MTAPAPTPLVPTILGLLVLASAAAGQAQETEETPEESKRWTNSTELSLVVTEGNSNTETFGFRNVTERLFERSRFRLRLDGTRSDTADDRFRVVDPGFSWEVGDDPPEVTTTLVQPSTEPDVEKYFVEGRYDAKITDRFTWNAGASWDRNRDAGILNRTILFAGVGNIWWDREDLEFDTSYGVSYTDREETTPDPERDEQFYGARFNWQYMNKWGKATTFTNNWTINANISDVQDFSFDMLSAVAVAINKHLALQVSLQWLYNNLPAFEEVDVIARVELIDPDGIPGSGDEFYQTVDGGGISLEVGTALERKKKLDTVFNTSLVVSF